MAGVGTERHPALLRREDTGLIAGGRAGGLPAGRSTASTEVVANCALLAAGFGVLGRPVLVSEQYPKGLGHTVAELAERFPDGAETVEKLRFSACGVDAFDEEIAAAGCRLGRRAASRPTSA